MCIRDSYNALDKNLDLQEKVNKEDMKNFDAAKIEYARLAIKAASVSDARKVPEGYTSCLLYTSRCV